MENAMEAGSAGATQSLYGETGAARSPIMSRESFSTESPESAQGHSNVRAPTFGGRLKRRLTEEAFVLSAQWKPTAFWFFVLLYMCGGAGGGVSPLRSIAFWRIKVANDQSLESTGRPYVTNYNASIGEWHGHEIHANGRLKDLGHDLVPYKIFNLSNWWNDVGMKIMQYTWVVMMLSLLIDPFSPSAARKPYFCSALRRFGQLYGMMHCARFSMYIVTSLPGANDRCLPPRVFESPQTWYSVFYYPVKGNCGDLVFSGHTMTCIMTIWFLDNYAEAAFLWSNYVHRTVIRSMYVFMVWQIFCIISARNHYTVDIVVALWFAPLFIFWYNRKVQTEDIVYKPELEDSSYFQSCFSAKSWHRK